MAACQVAWNVVQKQMRPPIPELVPEPLKALIKNCWAQEPKTRKDFQVILDELDMMESDENLINATNSFLGNKDEWELDYEEMVESMQTEEHS